jgi:hypothetical protein
MTPTARLISVRMSRSNRPSRWADPTVSPGWKGSKPLGGSYWPSAASDEGQRAKEEMRLLRQARKGDKNG